jgi:hypothetical protein
MKKPKDIQALAERLQEASSTPVGASPGTSEPAKASKRGAKSVFLRLSPEMYKKLDVEAVSRTKATGRGVTVQQVILDRLEGFDARDAS